MLKIINLTDKPLYMRRADDKLIQIAPSGTVARMAVSVQPVVLDLPDPVSKTVYVVSVDVLPHVTGRRDVMAPAAPVYDESGAVVGWDGVTPYPAYPVAAVQNVS